MGKNLSESLLGAGVLVGAVIFLLFAYSKSGLKKFDGYEVSAKFDRIDGLTEGSDVKMSGIKIGSVVAQELDGTTYLANLKLNVNKDVLLPRDSSIRVASNGLLGEKYLSITPGGEEEMIKPGGEITHTQGSVDLLSLVGRMIFSQGSEKKKDNDRTRTNGTK